MMEEVEVPVPQAPKDKYFATYGIMLLLGCGFLFPYNAFITAVDYFSHLYPKHNVEFAFPSVYTASVLVFMGLMVKWGNDYSFGVRIVGSFVAFFFVMVAVPVADAVLGETYEESGSGMFYATLGLLFLTGVADAVVQGSMYALAGRFPPLYIQAIQNGNGVAGIAVSMLRVFTKASLSDDTEGLRYSSILYFIISAMLVFACIIGYFVLMRLPFTIYYLGNPAVVNQDIELSMLTEGSLTDTSSVMSESSDSIEPPEVITQKDQPKEIINIRMVFYKVWKIGASVGFVFFITLLGFPGLMTTIPPSRFAADWYPILLITIFNLFDFLGKMTPAFFPNTDWSVPKRERGLFIATLSRPIFIVLFVMSVHITGARNEFFVIITVTLFAYSNGILGAILMMIGPTKVSLTEKETAGTTTAFFLVSGLAAGSTLSWIVEQTVKW